MGRYNIRAETYLDRELYARLNDCEEPNSEVLRQGLRRELQQREAEE